MPEQIDQPHHQAGQQLQSVNPATGEPGRSYRAHTLDEARAIAGSVAQAQAAWRRTGFAERAALNRAVAEGLRRRRDEFALLMTDEMGKPLADARGEVDKCAGALDWFAEHAPLLLQPRPVDMGAAAPGAKALVTFNPLGVVLAVMPWNFPFWQLIRFTAPNLMAGNGCLLKHASNVPGCALALEDVYCEAGAPADLFRTVLLPSREVEALIGDPNIAAVTLTGSVAAGRKVAEAAGRNLKKTVLELGGADAYLVLDDADVEAAAKVCAAGRMVNGGQSCIAAKRFIVLPPVKAAFETALTEAMRGYAMGDPREEATKFGPLSSVGARDEIHEQVEKSVAAGARLLLGGELPDRPGAWYPATVLTDVRPGQPAFDEEVFGPVASIIEAADEAEAVRIANASEFGLGSAVLTRDLARGERIAAEDLDAGMAFVNTNVRSDSRLPFGGVKHSGYGRECAEFGLLEFVNIKSVLVQS